MNMALHMHNSLVYEGVCSYFHWTLFWGGSSGLVSFPSYGGSDYVINPTYYTMKHFAKFTDPGWRRVDANTDSSGLRISAYKDPYDTNMAIVIINAASIDINLSLSLSGFTSSANWLTNEMYRTASTSSWASLGAFDPNQPLLIPAQSITTIHIAAFQNCADVQNNGFGLNSDLNGDCYIDYYDLKIIADNWLRNDCSGSNNWCGWADWPSMNGSVDFIDFNNFAPQWMTCNSPLDPKCTHNW
jgi:hypothetical protein